MSYYDNYPPGVTWIPGDFDKDASFTAYVTIYGTFESNGNPITPENLTFQFLTNHTIKSVKQNYLGVTPEIDSLIIDEIIPNEYVNYHFNATIEGDTSIDTQFTDPESWDIEQSIRDYIISELKSYNIYSDQIEIDLSNIDYEL